MREATFLVLNWVTPQWLGAREGEGEGEGRGNTGKRELWVNTVIWELWVNTGKWELRVNTRKWELWVNTGAALATGDWEDPPQGGGDGTEQGLAHGVSTHPACRGVIGVFGAHFRQVMASASAACSLLSHQTWQQNTLAMRRRRRITVSEGWLCWSVCFSLMSRNVDFLLSLPPV